MISKCHKPIFDILQLIRLNGNIVGDISMFKESVISIGRLWSLNPQAALFWKHGKDTMSSGTIPEIPVSERAAFANQG